MDAFEEVVKFERRWDCRRRSLVHPNVESGVVVELTTAPTIPNQNPGLAIARKKERKDHADVSTGVNHGVGVASFSTWPEFLCNSAPTGITRITVPLNTTLNIAFGVTSSICLDQY